MRAETTAPVEISGPRRRVVMAITTTSKTPPKSGTITGENPVAGPGLAQSVARESYFRGATTFPANGEAARPVASPSGTTISGTPPRSCGAPAPFPLGNFRV
jgi:hypothetical protein